ncbi:MAG: hypothetical protein ACOY0R_02380 [Chloroflexota bacterium]
MDPHIPQNRPQARTEEAHPEITKRDLDPNFTSSQAEQAMQSLGMQKAYKNAGSQFYWIAGLSLVNTLAQVFNVGFYFVAGLGVTQLIDALAGVFAQEIPEFGTIFLGVGLFLDFGILAMIALLGYLATRGYVWPVITGMVLYGLDALLVGLFKDFMGLIFHLFFLWQIWTALRALRYWRNLGQKPTDVPQNIGTP